MEKSAKKPWENIGKALSFSDMINFLVWVSRFFSDSAAGIFHQTSG
jgi:hypothetical protein